MEVQVDGCKMLRVVKKFKLLKRKLKELNMQHFINILTEASEDREFLVLAQRSLQANPLDLVLQQNEKVKYQKYI